MNQETTCWVQASPGEPLERRTLPVATRPGDVIVKVTGCGVCHTDLGFLDGSVAPRGGRPLVPGHEVSGIVTWAPPEHQPLVGRGVVVPAVWPCGECALCRHGRPNACQAQCMPGNDVRGGFAHHLAAPAVWLATVPPGTPQARLEELSVIADAVSTPYEAAMRAQLAAGELAVVVGAGGVGGFLVQIAAALGAQVLALDVDDARLELAAAHGALATLNVRGKTERDVRAWVRDAGTSLKARSWGVKVFETSGTAAGQRTAYELLGPAATLVVVGYTRDKIELRLSNLMAFDATAIGVWGCRPQYYPDVVKLVLEDKVKVGPYVERRPMSQCNDVVREAHEGKLRRRAILIPD